MHITRTLPVLLGSFIYTHNACMLAKQPATKIVKSATFCSTERHIETVKYFDVSEERRKAYQYWCPTPINWDQPHQSINTLSPKSSFEDKTTFCKQCGKNQLH